MAIENPQVFWLLLLLIPLSAIAVSGYFRGRKFLKVLGGDWRFGLFANVYLVKTFFSRLFFLLFFFFSVLSLADISWGDRLVEDDRYGYEIVFIVDISRSMLARDIESSRLDRVKREIRKFIRSGRGEQFSVVIFKGDAACILPMTEDIYSLDLVVDNLSPRLSTSPGSNPEAGILEGLNTFKSSGSYRLILLFTDGENSTGNPRAAAKMAAKAGIPIVTVGVGTEEGSEIILEDGRLLKDRNNQLVVSRLKSTLLADLAAISGGRYFNFKDLPEIRNEMLSILKKMDSGHLEMGLKLVRNRLYGIFLFLAVLFLILNLAIRVVKWKNTF